MPYLHPPKLKVGQSVKKLTITKYEGVKWTKAGDRTHHYSLVCACGETMAGIPQHRLLGHRKLTMCNKCAAKKRVSSWKKTAAKRDKRVKWRGWCIFDLWPTHPTDRGFIITH